jgi:allophanate hydrolase subunit 1
VEKSGALYVLEAKLAPNRWQRVDRVYPGISDLQAFYDRHADAHEAKAALKAFLNSKGARDITKRPIRIRLSVPIIDD